MTAELFLVMIAAHFVGDFVLQSDTMATLKSRDTPILFFHGFVYSVTMTVAAVVAVFPWHFDWEQFWALTFISHTATDAVTSRITSRLWFFRHAAGDAYFYVPGRRHWFFVMIGLDQVIHYATIYATLAWMFGDL